MYTSSWITGRQSSHKIGSNTKHVRLHIHWAIHNHNDTQEESRFKKSLFGHLSTVCLPSIAKGARAHSNMGVLHPHVVVLALIQTISLLRRPFYGQPEHAIIANKASQLFRYQTVFSSAEREKKEHEKKKMSKSSRDQASSRCRDVWVC